MQSLKRVFDQDSLYVHIQQSHLLPTLKLLNQSMKIDGSRLNRPNFEAKVPLSQQLNLSLSLQHLGKYRIQLKTLLLLPFQSQAS